MSSVGEKVSIIAVDDDARILNLMDARLSRMGYDVRCCSSGEAAVEEFEQAPSDIVLVDLDMPGMHGLDVLKAVRGLSDSVEVVVITGNADKDSAIEALRLGAFDFFEKPPNFDELDHTLKRTARYQAVVRERDQLSSCIDEMVQSSEGALSMDGFIGDSPPILEMKKTVAKMQENDRLSVLITGESGTGKELVARAIHYGGARSKRPFVAVNCAAIPEHLAESKLFGHVKGAFTGAIRDKKGCFEMADGGTLFLDEIGDVIPEVQAKFLRVLEDSMFLPVGATKDRKVDVRVIAATNSDLMSKVDDGSFRKDLYYRLERFKVEIPPLRERKEDIPALVDFFAARFAEEMGRQPPKCEKSFVAGLQNQGFPGNVRELRNLVERAVIESSDGVLRGSKSAPSEVTSAGESAVMSADVPMNLEAAQIFLAKKAVADAGGNMAEAARILGINRTKLYRILS